MPKFAELWCSGGKWCCQPCMAVGYLCQWMVYVLWDNIADACCVKQRISALKTQICRGTYHEIKFHRGVSLLKIPTLSMNVQFYSLQNSSYFIILCYVELKIDMFSWSWRILRSKCPKCPDTGECLACKSLHFKS